MIARCLLAIVLLLGACPVAQARAARPPLKLETGELAAPQATSESRALLRANAENDVRTALASEISSSTQGAWKNALWAMKLLGTNTPEAQKGMRRAISRSATLEHETQRALLETAYALDARAFRHEIARVAETTTHPKLFAMAALYTVRAAVDGHFESVRARRLATMQKHFKEWSQNPILTSLNNDLRVGRFSRNRMLSGKADVTSPTTQRPALSRFFSRDFAPGFPVVYSIHRRDRDFPGIAIVRNGNGSFVRTSFGNVFQVPHLARSMSDLPGYITNGNTPQGVFSIIGVDTTNHQAIGQTPFLETVLPFEVSPRTYFHDEALSATTWSAELYRNHLPGDDVTVSGWREYFPIYEAWLAGAAGRNEMLSHGTTVDPAFYLKQHWYPNTPTIGCMCAKEIWDPETGQALISDQLALVKAYLAAGGIDGEPASIPSERVKGQQGFFVVLEIDDGSRPVMLDDILMDLLAAENESHD